MEFLIFLIIACVFGLLIIGMAIVFRRKSKALESQAEKLKQEGAILATSFKEKEWLSKR